MSKRPAGARCTQTLEHGTGAISLCEASQAAPGAQASALSLESPDSLLDHMPALPLSLLASFQASFPLLAALQSRAGMKAHWPREHRAQGWPCQLHTHRQQLGRHIYPPHEIRVSSVAHECSLCAPGVCHPGTAVSVHLPVQGFAPGPNAGLPHVILPCLPV